MYFLFEIIIPIKKGVFSLKMTAFLHNISPFQIWKKNENQWQDNRIDGNFKVKADEMKTPWI